MQANVVALLLGLPMSCSELLCSSVVIPVFSFEFIKAKCLHHTDSCLLEADRKSNCFRFWYILNLPKRLNGGNDVYVTLCVY